MPTPPTNPLHAQTAAMLRAVAARGLAGTPLTGPTDDGAKRAYLDAFADEFGRRLPTHRPLLARLLNLDPGEAPRDLAAPAALLWALHDASIDPGALLRPTASPDQPGPLLYDPADDAVAIEWRTLDELTALHALWNLTLDPARPREARERWRARCESATRWHVAELQPDNATNHPWAVHVFYDLAHREPDPTASAAARFHAETLLHSSQVQLGRPDTFGACVLLDAARTLEHSVD